MAPAPLFRSRAWPLPYDQSYTPDPLFLRVLGPRDRQPYSPDPRLLLLAAAVASGAAPPAKPRRRHSRAPPTRVLGCSWSLSGSWMRSP